MLPFQSLKSMLYISKARNVKQLVFEHNAELNREPQIKLAIEAIEAEQTKEVGLQRQR